jgi:cytochrome c biogenesis protein CcdA
MFELTLLVATIALADSINPSTLVPALWLASGSSGRRLASYTLGVFAAYLTGGLILLLGPGPALIGALHHLHGAVEHGLQAFAGIVALIVAAALWRSRNRAEERPRSRRLATRASAFALGAGIMAIELPTAFMYFGAISAILASRPAASIQIALVVAYNLLFVAPLMVLLVIRRLAGARADRWIASAGGRLRYLGQIALTGVAGVAGAALLTIGLSGLLVL